MIVSLTAAATRPRAAAALSAHKAGQTAIAISMTAASMIAGLRTAVLTTGVAAVEKTAAAMTGAMAPRRAGLISMSWR